MKRVMILAMGVMALAGITLAQEDGFVSLFDGKTLNGWTRNGGQATYRVDNGTIVGTCTPGKPYNTFLCTEKEFGNFILKVDFKFDVPGNSGIQVRSKCRKPNKDGVRCVYGYQAELTPGPGVVGRIYDEGRRGFRHKLVWLDSNTPKDRLATSQAAFKRNDWNTMEVQCIGPSIRTWLNGKPVADIFDDVDMKGFIGLQVHAGKQGTVRWKNIRIKDLGFSEWKPFFVKGADGKMKLDGAHYVLPEDWSFQTAAGGYYLRGIHNSGEKRDGLIVSDKVYDNFIVRVNYQLFGGNSALYFRAHEVNTPWLLRGFQNEIAGNEKDSALWHTAGDKTPGRGWVARNDEWIAKFRKAKGWNKTFTAAVGDRIYNRLNGFETVDIVDPKCEKSGKVALQLHGGAKNELRFKDFEIMEITPEMRKLIER